MKCPNFVRIKASYPGQCQCGHYFHDGDQILHNPKTGTINCPRCLPDLKQYETSKQPPKKARKPICYGEPKSTGYSMRYTTLNRRNNPVRRPSIPRYLQLQDKP